MAADLSRKSSSADLEIMTFDPRSYLGYLRKTLGRCSQFGCDSSLGFSRISCRCSQPNLAGWISAQNLDFYDSVSSEYMDFT